MQFEVSETKLAAALDALRPFGVLRPKVFQPMPLPLSPVSEAEFERKAQTIATEIAPRPHHIGRADAIRLVLGGGDTFTAQQGEANPAIRNAIGSLSKVLRRFDRFAESPLEIICDRKREVFAKGDAHGEGQYKGIRYVPNRLGERVLQILEERGAL
ncbi:MAG: hypothetical protein R3D89_00875 [Sphingomonadaceae bacterium]